MQHITPASHVVMVRPYSFCSNPETAGSNAFQNAAAATDLTGEQIRSAARNEFDQLADELRKHDIQVSVFHEAPGAETPDALFPNNWFISLPDGRALLMPMHAENRRREYREDIIQSLNASEITDLRPLVEKNLFLEGTGSLILDHERKTGYACRSARTSDGAVRIFEERTGYRITLFDAVDEGGRAIYHTNVMMALSPDLVVINLSAIRSEEQKKQLRAGLSREVIDISHGQMRDFAGNMLFLRNSGGKNFWVCSRRAYRSLTADQLKKMQTGAGFIFADLDTIETHGGGGARCLLAEVFTRDSSLRRV